MIADKFIDLYARNSGVRDKLVAERDVVLTYALHALHQAGVAEHLAFKGGTCLRKTVFGSTGRFSEDLDFTLDSALPADDVLVKLVEVFNREHHAVVFTFEEYYKTDDDGSFGGDVSYSHAWNVHGHFRLQVSLRERPTLVAAPRDLKPQGYFGQLEFAPFAIRSLDVLEMMAEKLRAAFQRVKVRDLYDLHRFATERFDGEILRRLAVLKLWQAKDPFEPDRFFEKIRDGLYEWEDLTRLMRRGERLDANVIITSVERRFAFLRSMSDLERAVVADSRSGRDIRLAEQLRGEIRQRLDRGMRDKGLER